MRMMLGTIRRGEEQVCQWLIETMSRIDVIERNSQQFGRQFVLGVVGLDGGPITEPPIDLQFACLSSKTDTQRLQFLAFAMPIFHHNVVTGIVENGDVCPIDRIGDIGHLGIQLISSGDTHVTNTPLTK